MQKAMYPCKIIRITQKDHVGTHKSCWAVDEAGIDGGISNFIMPFDGVVKKIYTSDANEVWIESSNKVEYADGTIDYMTIMFAHDNNVSDLYVGKLIKAGTIFYQEGTKGQATGNHVHFECGKGKFTGSGWYKDASGYWSIINGKKVTDCLWIDDSYTIKDTKGYNFRKVMTTVGTPVARNEEIYQVKVFDTTTTLRGRKAPNGDILGYMNSGIYNLLERKADGDYEWFKVENNLWFAYNPDWCEYLPKKEIIVEPPKEETKEESQEEIKEEVKEEITTEPSTENTNNNDVVVNKPKFIYESTKDDYYAIYLFKNQKLYLE